MSKSMPDPRKINIVSSPRSKASATLKPISFRLPPDQLLELEELARSRNVSRSHLVVQAIERCKKDGIWRVGLEKQGDKAKSLVPPADLVTLSNQLLAFAIVLEQMLPRIRSQKAKDQASRIYWDARLGLENLRSSLGC
ncbi:ribbon-helix-helix protein, CopG family [Variovorax sp. RHLX14]|uniref:ribbon-helix-helix protein, CopG family n=1 Tax=Variovorax sp. RHLX14 TaxID=1259731 RepID=UPI003F4597FE